MTITNNKKRHLYPEEAVNWKELEAIGIYREDLEASDGMDLLLDGEKAGPVNLRLMLAGIDLDFDATLQLVQVEGACTVEIKGISPETLP